MKSLDIFKEYFRFTFKVDTVRLTDQEIDIAIETGKFFAGKGIKTQTAGSTISRYVNILCTLNEIALDALTTKELMKKTHFEVWYDFNKKILQISAKIYNC